MCLNIIKQKEIIVSYTMKKPKLEDSKDVYKLVDRCKPLDLNSEYCYMLVCDHFKETSVIAVDKSGAVVGFVSAYINPSSKDTLFVWQVAVDSSARGEGLALEMLKNISKRENLKEIAYITSTISPQNSASIALFKRLAKELNAKIDSFEYIKIEHFINSHEDEMLFKIEL